MTLEILLLCPIAGNAHQDMELMKRIDLFAKDESKTMDDRCAALRHLGTNVMGLTDEVVTEDMLNAYLKECE